MTQTVYPEAIILACWPSEDPLLAEFSADSALLPMGDKPMLQRVVERLVELGCRRITVVHGDRPQAAEVLLGDGERWGCQILHQYAADGSRPLGLLARTAPAGEQLCILAAAHSVVLSELDATRPCVALGAATGPASWTGWAVLPGRLIRSLAQVVHSSQDLAARVQAYVDQSPELTLAAPTLSTRSVAASLDSLPRLFSLSQASIGIDRRPQASGIWIGNGSRIHGSVRLAAPVYIGQNVLIAEGVEIGPNVVVGDGCIVDRGSRIEDSVLLQRTYVGQELDLRRTMLAGNSLANARLGVALRLADAEFLRDVDRADWGGPKVPLPQRVLAAILLPCLLPLRLLARPHRFARPGAVPAGIGAPTPVASLYRPLQVGFSATHSAVQQGLDGAWREHLHHTFVPGLRDVVAGRVALVGLQPRSAAEISALPHYWRRLYDRSPIGLVNEALLHGDEDASAEMLHAGDALAAAPLPLWKVASILWRYAKRVMRDAGTCSPERARMTEKPAITPAP